MKIKTIPTIYGDILCPNNFLDLLTLLQYNEEFYSGVRICYWRGQADIKWRLDSGAVRRLKNDTIQDDIDDYAIELYEKRLIDKAKKNLFHNDQFRILSDIELLIKLQHHGAATRFMDFSKNALVALWFCINNKSYINDYGLLIGINTDILHGYGEENFNFEDSYDTQIETLEKLDGLFSIDPTFVTNRISAQHAVLIYGKYCNSQYGSLDLGSVEKHKTIAISPQLKAECQQILTDTYNITFSTMFPDFQGFCDSNSVEWGQFELDRW